jgi:hypothetical protein
VSPRLSRIATPVLIAVGLGIDAGVHLHLASQYAGLRDPGGISQGTLFQIEAGASIAVAILVLALPRLITYLLAGLVAGSALGAVLLYHFVDIGSLGPLPDMYDPGWDGMKTLSAAGEAFALLVSVAAAVLLALRASRGRRAGGRSESTLSIR